MSTTGVTAKDFMLSRGDLRLMGRTQQAMDLHGKSQMIAFEGKQWKTVSAEIDWANEASSQWVLLGSTYTQENLYFDENSEFVSKFKYIAEDLCKGKSTREVLDTVKMMVNRITEMPGKTRYEVESTLDARLESFISDKRKHLRAYEFANISFEELAAQKLLVCRHKGLLAASVIGHLVKKGVLPQGTAREYRSVLIDNQENLLGAHLWATYRDNTTDTLWICDPRFDNVMNVNSEYSAAAATYGRLAVDDMITRLTRIEAKQRFDEDMNLLGKAYIKTAPGVGKMIVLETHDLANKQRLVSRLEHEGVRMEFSDKFPNMIVIKQAANPRKFDLYENALTQNQPFVEHAGTKTFTFASRPRPVIVPVLIETPAVVACKPVAAPAPVVTAFSKARTTRSTPFSCALDYFRGLENQLNSSNRLVR